MKWPKTFTAYRVEIYKKATYFRSFRLFGVVRVERNAMDEGA